VPDRNWALRISQELEGVQVAQAVGDVLQSATDIALREILRRVAEVLLRVLQVVVE